MKSKKNIRKQIRIEKVKIHKRIRKKKRKGIDPQKLKK